MKVLVCGGRDYAYRAHVTTTLSALHAEHAITHVIHGCAEGADTFAGDWAKAWGVQEVRCPANWAEHGSQAGYLRNLAMAALVPDLVLAFPGGKGTRLMVKIAVERNIKVRCLFETHAEE